MKVLMVCLGNICRSPLAEGILKNKLYEKSLQWEVDSAGTSAWHIGEKPDSRSIATARNYGIDISDQRARQFNRSDFSDFDLILCMDQSNYNNVRNLAAGADEEDKVKLVLNYLYPGENRPVPDPYFDNSFDRVYEMLDSAMEKLIEQNS